MASPQLLRIKQMLGVRPRDRFELQAFRDDFERFARYFPPPPGTRSRDLTLGGVPAREILPEDGEVRGKVFYLHGGGYISGSVDTHLEIMTRLALESRTRVLGIDYRRAPEHPFPAAFEDALAAYGELVEKEGGEDLAVVGDSAGGGLALALMAAVRDSGGPLPKSAVLFSPWADLTMSGDSVRERVHLDKVLHPRVLERATALYLEDADPLDPRVSPLFGDLSGLPPTLIQVGTSEVLLDDSKRLARAMAEAGSAADLRIWDEMIHLWQFYASILPEGGAAIQEAGVFLSENLVAR